MPIIPRQIKCECIDKESLGDLKLALITSRDTYLDISIRFPELKAYAKKMDELLDEFSKIPPCQIS